MRNYKGVKVNDFGIPTFLTESKKTIINNPGRKFNQHEIFHYNFKNTAPKDQILICNIPAIMRKERDWLRRHLKRFDYIMIQKNVWVGPSPLPKDFLDYTKSIYLVDKLLFLKLETPYIKGKSSY